MHSAVEPPASDHPRCADLVVAYGRWSLTRIEPQGVSSEKMFRRLPFGQRIYCIQFLFCELSIRLVPCCHCKFLVCSEWRSTYGSEQRNNTIRQVVASNPVTTTSIGKSLSFFLSFLCVVILFWYVYLQFFITASIIFIIYCNL